MTDPGKQGAEESLEEQIRQNKASAIEVAIKDSVTGIQEELQQCTKEAVVNVAKNVNCHSNQLVISLCFAAIVLEGRQIQTD